jgi:arylsulfatase A-like enzyme
LLAGLATAIGLSDATAAQRRPNIVMLVADNLGYGDVGCCGNAEIKTPRLDRLAAEGVRCTDFYSASPTCTVSRASLLTGRYPQRNGLTWQLGVEENRSGIGLRHSERILPDYLKEPGYATACFGKWNIGFAPGSRPTDRGFDEFFGHRSGNMDYYTHVYNGVNDLVRGIEPAVVEGYSTDLFADAACGFLRRHAEEPFFLYAAFNAPHYPNPRNKKPGEPVVWQAPDEAFRAYGYSPDTRDEKERYQAVVTALDAGIGRILDQIASLGLADDTLVIFFSDNGAFLRKGAGLGCASNDPLRTDGLVLYEGNIRVPCIVRWPGKIEPGTVCREPLVHMDFFAMALDTAGGHLPADRTIDGRNPTAALTGKAPSPHDALFFQYLGASAVRCGRYKLLQTGKNAPWQLFDLIDDMGETRDLAAEKPDSLAELRRKLASWSEEVKRN